MRVITIVTNDIILFVLPCKDRVARGPKVNQATGTDVNFTSLHVSNESLFMPNYDHRGRDSPLAVSIVSDTVGQSSDGGWMGDHQNRASRTVKQTAHQLRRAAALVATPMNGHPGKCIGVGSCYNRPRSRGNRRSRLAQRCPPHTPDALHTLSHRAACQRTQRTLSAPRWLRRITRSRFCRSLPVLFYA